MYKHRLCLGLLGNPEISENDQIRLFAETGFDGFFSGWSRNADISSLRQTADETGMMFQSVHAPFTLMADLWTKSGRTHEALNELISCLRDCADNSVPVMVAHAFIGFEDHSPTSFGLDNFGAVVSEAQRLGISIAFENTEGEEYLAALMKEFAGCKNVGFCWDTGHEMCYNHGRDMLSLYGDRLIATHINDNLGIKDNDGQITWLDDLHLLPFDGIGNWTDIAARLDRHGFSGPLTFELGIASKPGRHENDAYGRMDFRDYITEAYMRACRVASLRKMPSGTH